MRPAHDAAQESEPQRPFQTPSFLSWVNLVTVLPDRQHNFVVCRFNFWMRLWKSNNSPEFRPLFNIGTANRPALLPQSSRRQTPRFSHHVTPQITAISRTNTAATAIHRSVIMTWGWLLFWWLALQLPVGMLVGNYLKNRSPQ